MGQVRMMRFSTSQKLSDFRKRSRIASLHMQLMLATAFPIIALLLALTSVSIFAFTRSTQTLVEQRDAELVQLAAQQVASYWADSVLLLSQAGATREIMSGHPPTMRALLQANVALRQRFDRLAITDAEGHIVTAVESPFEAYLGDRPFFVRARDLRRPARSSRFELPDGAEVIAVAVPIYDHRRQFAGCIIGLWELPGQALGAALAQVRVGPKGYAYLVNDQGIILSHPDQELVGADAHEHPAVEALLRGETGAQTVMVQGHRTVVGYTPIPFRELSSSLFADETWDGWGLLTSELWEDIIAPLRTYTYLIVALLVLIVASPTLILLLASRRVTAPLRSLVEQVERISAGQLDAEVSLPGGAAEVRDLQIAFNQMVTELRKSRADIRRYVASILNSQEEERKRIARELHDETAQALIVLGRRIENAAELAGKGELAQELEKLRDMVDDSLQGVRRFTSDLRPPLLEELGLPRALEILARRTEREEMFTVDVRIEGTPQALLPELELGLYRLAQESLSNVRRHAQANHAEVILRYETDAVELFVIDDGIGFDVPEDPGELLRLGRLGLMGIHERARLFGGEAWIESERGRGTSVRVRIPLSPLVLPEKPHKRTDRRRTFK